ncbi:MAG: hypothetical protein AAFQ87_04060, partial [Bacteroidota bacterium]
MNKLLCFLLLGLVPFAMKGQYQPQLQPFPDDVNDTLSINAIQALFHATGDMFYDMDGRAIYRHNATDSLNTLFAGNLWVGALDVSGTIRPSGQTYRQNDNNHQPGPVSNLYDSLYNERYHQVWKIRKATIDQHIANWQAPGYIVPSSLTDWPAHGDTARQEAYYLAPFVDVNGSGTYEPELGDYPAMRGDEALYIMFNDDRYSPFPALQMETHLMAYAYDTPGDSILNKSIFLHYQLFNRSNQLYQDAWIGYWSDLELGYAFDDDFGTDSLLHTLYVYNRDSIDGYSTNPGFGYGYGEHPPAQGITMLNLPLSATMSYYVDFTDDSIGGPLFGEDFYYLLQGRWKDDQPVTVGGRGRGGSQTTTYFLSGDPVSGTGWLPHDSASVFFNQDRKDVKALMSHGPFDLAPGESICMDLGLVYARDMSRNHLGNLSLLREHINHVRNYYETQSENCLQNPNNRPTAPIPDKQFLLFPNPSSDLVQLRWEAPFEWLAIYDIHGRLLRRTPISERQKYLRLSTEEWVPGFYTIIMGGNG